MLGDFMLTCLQLMQAAAVQRAAGSSGYKTSAARTVLPSCSLTRVISYTWPPYLSLAKASASPLMYISCEDTLHCQSPHRSKSAVTTH